jgi:hypothetical protein
MVSMVSMASRASRASEGKEKTGLAQALCEWRFFAFEGIGSEHDHDHAGLPTSAPRRKVASEKTARDTDLDSGTATTRQMGGVDCFGTRPLEAARLAHLHTTHERVYGIRRLHRHPPRAVPGESLIEGTDARMLRVAGCFFWIHPFKHQSDDAVARLIWINGGKWSACGLGRTPFSTARR